MNALGCDVSYWQGPNSQFPNGVDWKKAHDEGGIAFAFARACRGAYYTDPTFQIHWDGMKAAGVLRGAFCYFLPNRNPEAQAALLFSLTNGQGELPDVIDVETDQDMTRLQLRERVKRCLDEYETLSGRKPIIYTRASWWDYWIGEAGWEHQYPLWVAHYFANAPNVPTAWQSVGWKFWQDSDQETFPGFQDPTVDRDHYNGTEADLREWLGVQPAPPTLEERVSELEKRVSDLEAIAHTHPG